MGRTTLWYLDDKEKSYESIKETFESKQFNLNADTYPDFKLELITDSQVLHISNFDISYCLYNYSILTPSYERISNILILFKKGTKIGFIVEKGSYSMALTFLRALCGYTQNEKNVIIPEEYHASFLNGDMFFWIISKIYHDDSDISYTTEDGSKKNFSLDSLDGLKGMQKATLNKVSTQGSDVINMLTTLAFLIESERLTEVSLDTTYDIHDNIKFIIHNHRKIISLDVDTKSYVGDFSDKDDVKLNGKINDFKLRALLLLVGHLGFIPMLQSLYQLDAGNLEVKKDLIIEITEDISNRINELQIENGIETQSDNVK